MRRRQAAFNAAPVAETKENLLQTCLAFLGGVPSFDNSTVVSGYYAIRGEIDIVPLLAGLHRCGNPVALPVILPGPTLIFREWTPETILQKRKFGLMEPPDDSEELFPDIVLVPLLAFDKRGNRLGYGAGYYDAGLCRLRQRGKVIAAAVAYAEQELEAIPNEPQDELLDYILTPSGIVRCGD